MREEQTYFVRSALLSHENSKDDEGNDVVDDSSSPFSQALNRTPLPAIFISQAFYYVVPHEWTATDIGSSLQSYNAAGGLSVYF